MNKTCFTGLSDLFKGFDSFAQDLTVDFGETDGKKEENENDNHVVYSRETVSGGICTLLFFSLLFIVTVINLRDLLDESSYETSIGSLQRTDS